MDVMDFFDLDEVVPEVVARKRGLQRYFTGVDCKHGHVAERYVTTRRCVECERKYNQEWAKNNRDKMNAKND